MKFIWFAIAGVISGIIAGMGMGGGTLLIPILTLFLKIDQRLAQGINLIVFVPMAIATLIIHCKNKLVDLKIGVPIMVSGIFSSLIGSLMVMKISSYVLRKCFGVFLLLVGVWQIVSIFYPKKEKKKQDFKIVGFFKYK